jgi:hypothetical protein
MVKADTAEIAFRVLKFERFEKVYAAKLRLRVSDKALALELGTSIPNVKIRLERARRTTIRKVLLTCRKSGVLDNQKLSSLVELAGIKGPSAKVALKVLGEIGTLKGNTKPKPPLAKGVDAILSRLFKSPRWVESIAWRDKRTSLRGKRKRIRERHEKRYTAGVTKKISWEEIGEGVLNDVTKGSQTWNHWRDVISRSGNDAEKRSLVNMLGSEMELLYGRYRREKERESGKAGRYMVYGGEKRYAKIVATNCLMRDIHPVELLQYWDDNASHFTDQMYPTLAFLKGAYAIETIATRKPKDAKPKDGNTHSDLEGLYPKFRRLLEDAGFATQRYPDRMLLSIQYMAVQKAKGHNFFIDDKDKRKMIEWAAKEIFSS